jgi:guanine deaminase
MNPVSLDRVEFYNPGYLVVDGERIARLSQEDPRQDFPAAEFIDLTGNVILPGLVDTHVHLPQFAIMGIGNGELLGWLNEYTYPEESRFSNPDYAERVANLFFDEMIANGTTAAAVYCSVHEQAADIAFSVARDKGIRAFIGKVMMDRNSPPSLQEGTDESIAQSTRLFEKWDGAGNGRLRYIFSPRFAGACSMDLMKRVGRIATERNAYIQSHLSENQAEVAWIRSLFPGHSSYTDVYREAGLLGPRSIMGHCIHLGDGEVSLLARTDTKVSFCPYSNRTLHSGTMPYAKLRDAGLTIGLGTDIAGGPSLSMFRQMGEAMNSANASEPSLTPACALYLATLGGAKVLGLDREIGNFAPGKDADFVVLRAEEMDPLHGLSDYNQPAHVLSRICFNAASNHLHAVYARGRCVNQSRS